MGLVSPKTSRDDLSQLDDTGNTTADVLVEALNSTQSSSSSSSSEWNSLLAEPVNPIVNESCNILQGRVPHLENNQNLGGTLPEDFGWSVGTVGDSTLSLPPAPLSMDISSVPDPNGIVWPDLKGSFWPHCQRDLISQLDFDLPPPAEPDTASTSASSSALSELDLSQLYNQSTQGFDSAGVSRDIIDYLSLGEKVSTNTIILT